MVDNHREIAQRIEALCRHRSNPNSSMTYRDAAMELRECKIRYNEFWKENPDVERPHGLIEEDGAFYLKHWPSMGGYGGLQR